ncbi:mannosyltransferase family protein [Amycolatopsis thermoflava]|uniref:mannosyltransferase family protein n=1 Tax=Amycolatopsis thermoflava TaxID=84480 RepID=UPI00365DA10C
MQGSGQTVRRPEQAAPGLLLDLADRITRRRALLLPAAVYLGVRALGVVVLTVFAALHDTDLLSRIAAWDGQWYLKIAASGYELEPTTDALGHLNPHTPRAFFPGYPFLIRLLAPALGFPAAALVVSLAAGLFAAYGLARLGRLVRGGSRRAGYILVALFAATPMSVVLTMAYTEALFCALAVWTLVAVLERRWEPAGVCCLAAGLVRSTALALVVAVAVAALMALTRRQDGGRPLVALALAPAGLFGYLWWTGMRVRPESGIEAQLSTWSDLEWQGWRTRFDGGVSTARFVAEVLTGSDSAMSVLTVAVIAGALIGMAVLARRETVLVAYAAGVLMMCLGSSALMHAKPRLLLPAFTLLVPVALALAKRRTNTVLWVCSGVALASAWFGAFALTVWQYAI